MATATVTQVSTTASASATPTSTLRATPQGGILQGANPAHYDAKDPIILFIIQAGIIIIFCRILHHGLSRLRQPRVIAEVLGGIVLGPSVMGHIPGFTQAIFPPESKPTLSLVANLGLVLFLFLVGLEVDLRFLASNWKIALSVGALGMALPFGLGFAIAYGLYHQFRQEEGLVPIEFGVYMLFVGVAMAITAFPVLCRILTELKLLQTPVGIIVLSAGVGNDVVGWILLALCVALVNASSGLTALWVLLTAVGYTLFLFFAVKPSLLWYLKRTNSLENGPNQSVVALTLLMALSSAFFTGIIGIHPIFGAFMIGLICPHDGGFAIKITEKIEDIVGALFLPLYFALSGLNTNLSLLDDGITWAYVVGVTSVAFFAKISGGTIAAKLNGLVWRESLTIGVLMSCKGLVELIVLNIGLQARILSTRTFTIFVVMALVTTFATTPLTSLLYPRWYQIKLEAWKRGEIDWDDNRRTDSDSISFAKIQSSEVGKLLTYLRIDSMAGILKISSLLAKNPSCTSDPKVHPTKQRQRSLNTNNNSAELARPLQVHAVRLMELTDRDSSVMKVSEIDEYTKRDPIVNTFRTFGQLNNIAVAGAVLVVPEASFAVSITDKAMEVSADLILIPWTGSSSMNENVSPVSDTSDHRFENSSYSNFVATTMKYASCNIAIFVDQGFGGSKSAGTHGLSLQRSVSGLMTRDADVPTAPNVDQGHHVFFPYFGSEDDTAALRFVLQLAQNPCVTATIVQFKIERGVDEISSADNSIPESGEKDNKNPVTVTALGSPPDQYGIFFAALRDSLPTEMANRVVFETQRTSSPFNDTMEYARKEVGLTPNNAGDLIVLGRNSVLSSTLMAGTSESSLMLGTEARRSLGVMAEGVIRKGLNASLLVMMDHKRTRSTDRVNSV